MTMSQPTIFRRPSQQQQDLVTELRQFIAGATFAVQSPPLDLLKTAVYLLKNLPASRDAVLQYFSFIFENVVENYVLGLGNDKSTGKVPNESSYDEAAITEINTILSYLVSECSVSWVPIICSWCLQLLGNISSKYSEKVHFTGNLNESLQFWMNCRATRALIEITTQCLSSLMTSDTETCIQSLLDTSVKHSPYFDWVVAHVGSCFPQTVITRVLSCGLKAFYQCDTYEQVSQSAKLKSVVGILGHLAASHSDHLKYALMDIFKLSLESPTNATITIDYDIVIMNQSTLPYLLQLAKLSNTILAAVCSNIKECLTLNMIFKLYESSKYWGRYFGNLDIMRDIIISLIPNCESGGSSIIKILLECGNLCSQSTDKTRENIKNNAIYILEYIIQELDACVREQTTIHSQTLPLLKSLICEIYMINEMLVSENALNCRTAAKIVILIGHLNHSLLIESVSYLFKKSNDDFHLALVVRMITDELIDKNLQPYISKEGHFSVILEQCLGLNNFTATKNCSESEFNRIISNLKTLLRWESSMKIYKLQGKPITKGIAFNLVPFTAILNAGKLSTDNFHIMCEILEIVFIDNRHICSNIKLEAILNIVNGFVDYFFIVCSEKDTTKQCKAFRRICNILQYFSTESKLARNLAIRSILEKALFGEDALLFGALKDNNSFDDNDLPILKQNKKISKAIQLTKHSSVYNGGIIGNGRRKSICHFPLPPTHTITSNTHQVMRVIRACCTPAPITASTAEEHAQKQQQPSNNDNDVSSSSFGLLGVTVTGTATDSSRDDGGNGNGDDSKNTSSLLLDSMTWLSLLLVQFVSPDVMYNGLPWPEEEFSKVTIERDLHIRRLFTRTPLLWELLSMVAVHRPTLCYSSVLLRALMATILHQWTSMGDQSKGSGTGAYKQLMHCTVRVLDVMALGQLLPPPLCSVRDVVPHLTSYEIVAVLRDCIWAYMRDCVPSPALFTEDGHGGHWRDPTAARPPPPYTDTLRVIMQRNIGCTPLGQLYGQLFITLPKD